MLGTQKGAEELPRCLPEVDNAQSRRASFVAEEFPGQLGWENGGVSEGETAVALRERGRRF